MTEDRGTGRLAMCQIRNSRVDSWHTVCDDVQPLDCRFVPTPTKQFGYLMLTILLAGVVAELVLLPALLAGPLGRVFRPRGVAPEPSLSAVSLGTSATASPSPTVDRFETGDQQQVHDLETFSLGNHHRSP